MNVKILATRTCTHRPDLEKELDELGVSYELLFVEEHPDAVAHYVVRHSPTLIVDDQVVFHGQPSGHELRAFFENIGSRD
ncbi:MAG TPA: thioredoxin family protein [Thiohalobacter sp.]|nr:thioredoxin family protein [Thiohalobacter sp.]